MKNISALISTRRSKGLTADTVATVQFHGNLNYLSYLISSPLSVVIDESVLRQHVMFSVLPGNRPTQPVWLHMTLEEIKSNLIIRDDSPGNKKNNKSGLSSLQCCH